MAAEVVNIPTTVSSLIAAFTSVRDVLDRTIGRQPSSRNDRAPRKTSSKRSQDTKSFSRSIQNAPLAIEKEYVRGYKVHGRGFERGDGTTHASHLMDSITATDSKISRSTSSPHEYAP